MSKFTFRCDVPKDEESYAKKYKEFFATDVEEARLMIRLSPAWFGKGELLVPDQVPEVMQGAQESTKLEIKKDAVESTSPRRHPEPPKDFIVFSGTIISG